jgi:hypothetical protein
LLAHNPQINPPPKNPATFWPIVHFFDGLGNAAASCALLANKDDSFLLIRGHTADLLGNEQSLKQAFCLREEWVWSIDSTRSYGSLLTQPARALVPQAPQHCLVV